MSRSCSTSGVLSCQRVLGQEPVVLECADAGDAFIVAVVVHEGHARCLCGAADQEVDRWHPAMLSAGGKQQLQLASALPQGCRQRYGFEGVESLLHLFRACLVGAQTDELEDHEVADEHMAGRDLRVEPGGEPREAPVSCPSPHARVK